MAFTVNDFSDLVRLLAQHPEWQAELRQQYEELRSRALELRRFL
jgi:hypothetical protein